MPFTRTHEAKAATAVLFGRVLDVYLEVTGLSVSTRPTHESYIRRIIRPVLGDVKARKIGPDTLDVLNTHPATEWPRRGSGQR